MQKHKKLPNLDFLLKTYDLDPMKGTVRKKTTGKVMGWADHNGYQKISIKGKVYQLHRIIFYMYHRRKPGSKVIDHIDGNKKNNCILNLRLVSHGDNTRNTQAQRDAGNFPKPEPGAYKVLSMPAIKADPTPDY